MANFKETEQSQASTEPFVKEPTPETRKRRRSRRRQLGSRDVPRGPEPVRRRASKTQESRFGTGIDGAACVLVGIPEGRTRAANHLTGEPMPKARTITCRLCIGPSHRCGADRVCCVANLPPFK